MPPSRLLFTLLAFFLPFVGDGGVASTASGGGAIGGAPEQSSPQCRYVTLASPLARISSAVFVPTVQKILVADSARRQLVLVSPDGYTSPVDVKLQERAKLPVLLASTPNGFVLKLISSEILPLDQSLNLREDPKRSAVVSSAGTISQLTVADSWILAYGSKRSATLPDGYQLGFLRMPLSELGGSAVVIHPFAQFQWYVLGFPYMASIGDTAYFLEMGERPVLYEVRAGKDPVPLSNKVLRDLPALAALKTMNGPGDASGVFASLEKKPFPAGLYSGPDDSLNLLVRRPGKEDGEADWWLHRIGSGSRADDTAMHLPTSAAYLTVVPSKEWWYFFEKGQVNKVGGQPIPSMLKVPAGRITHASGPSTELCPELRH